MSNYLSPKEKGAEEPIWPVRFSRRSGRRVALRARLKIRFWLRLSRHRGNCRFIGELVGIDPCDPPCGIGDRGVAPPLVQGRRDTTSTPALLVRTPHSRQSDLDDLDDAFQRAEVRGVARV